MKPVLTTCQTSIWMPECECILYKVEKIKWTFDERPIISQQISCVRFGNNDIAKNLKLSLMFNWEWVAHFRIINRFSLPNREKPTCGFIFGFKI